METVETNNHDAFAQPGEQPPPTKEQKILSRKQFGQWRNATHTVKLPSVSSCGHKFHMNAPPTNNCFDCWYVYFTKCVDLGLIHEQFRISVEKTIALYGSKYVKMFRRFIEVELASMHTETITNPEAIPGAVPITDSFMTPETKEAFETSVAQNPELLALLTQGKEIIADAKERLNGLPEETRSTEGA